MPVPVRPAPKARQKAAKGRRPAAKRKPPPPRSGMDMFHLLAVVAGAYMGLALYAFIMPGQMPDEQAVVKTDPRLDLSLTKLKGGRGADGFMHVRGEVQNARTRLCRVAGVRVRFFDRAGKEVADIQTTVNDIQPRSAGAFSVRAHAPGAVRFEVAIDLAQFAPGGR